MCSRSPASPVCRRSPSRCWRRCAPSSSRTSAPSASTGPSSSGTAWAERWRWRWRPSIPDLAGPLVIVDSLPFLAGAQLGQDARRRPSRHRRDAGVHDDPDSRAVSGVHQGRHRDGIHGESAADHDTIKQWGLGSDQRTVAEAMADLMGTDVRQDAAKITSPTLVLGTWIGLHEQLKKYGMALSRADVIEDVRAAIREASEVTLRHRGHREALHHVRRPAVALRRARPVSRQSGPRRPHARIREMRPPVPGSAYWICQAAGWGGFVTYVLGGYLLTAPRPDVVDVTSIVFFNGVACPASIPRAAPLDVRARLAPVARPASVRASGRRRGGPRARSDGKRRARAGDRRPVRDARGKRVQHRRRVRDGVHGLAHDLLRRADTPEAGRPATRAGHRHPRCAASVAPGADQSALPVQLPEFAAAFDRHAAGPR